VAAVLLMVGGMMAASAPTPGTPASRGVGILIAVAGVGMAFMAGRSRNGDARFRRAAIALSGAVVVIVALTAPLGVYIFTLIGVVLLIIGTILNALPRRDRD
jgi:peptidoglycan/LPS O-acetylase OafA/YrhL